MYKHLCKNCGKSIEVALKRAVCRCSCGTPMTNMGELPNNYKSLRLVSGLSQNQATDVLDTTKTYVSVNTIENDKKTIPQLYH